MRKVRVGILFGGRSGEHEVSLASARSILAALDPDKYEAVPIGITREGQWLFGNEPERMLEREVTLQIPRTQEAVLDVSHHAIERLGTGSKVQGGAEGIDVVFPVLHGPQGEDGTVQGMLEIMRLPYVGAEVLASAVSMDKGAMKLHFEAAGLPGVPYCLLRKRDWSEDPDRVIADIEHSLHYPVFVKPCNMGSSVGISKAHDRGELYDAVSLAARYDRKIIVEGGIEAREVEVSVLGNDEPIASLPGEVISHHEFYDYEAKYTEGLTDLQIPADLTPEQTQTVRDLAIRAFRAVDASGMARVDFFVTSGDGRVLVNEINTIPGFTQTSMYPKLWEQSGIPYSELIDRLIQLAMERFDEREQRSVTR